MVYVNDYSKEIFKDPLLLRSKLALFLGTPDKVEIYAQACEKFYAKGGGLGLAFNATWSWWGFFMGCWWALYRKQYIVALVLFILFAIPFVNLLVAIGCGVYAKYAVCKSFVETLNMQNDAFLSANGGCNAWVVWLILFILAIAFIFIFLAFIVYIFNAIF